MSARAATRVSDASTPLQASVLTTTEALERLVPEWQVLSARAPRPSPFTAPAWLLNWWRHRGGGPLRVITLRAAGRLVGLLPMFIFDDRGTRRLLPLGVGVSDMFDMLVEQGSEDAAIVALRDTLAAIAHEWQRCEFHELPTDSVLHLLGGRTTMQNVSPVLHLPSFARAPRRSGAVRRLARARARTTAAGLVEEAAGPDDVDALVALHTAQWRRRGEGGVLGDDATVRFHRAVAPALTRDGALRSRRVRDGRRVVAVLHAFGAGRRVFAYLNGIDPAYAPLGLGTVMIGGLIEAALADGLRELDFGRGAETYKFGWGATNRVLLRLDHPHPSHGGRRGGVADEDQDFVPDRAGIPIPARVRVGPPPPL